MAVTDVYQYVTLASCTLLLYHIIGRIKKETVCSVFACAALRVLHCCVFCHHFISEVQPAAACSLNICRVNTNSTLATLPRGKHWENTVCKRRRTHRSPLQKIELSPRRTVSITEGWRGPEANLRDSLRACVASGRGGSWLLLIPLQTIAEYCSMSGWNIKSPCESINSDA